MDMTGTVYVSSSNDPEQHTPFWAVAYDGIIIGQIMRKGGTQSHPFVAYIRLPKSSIHLPHDEKYDNIGKYRTLMQALIEIHRASAQSAQPTI